MNTRTNIATISREIISESDAYLYLEDLRWHGTPRCPKCRSREVAYVEPRNGVSRTTAGGAQSERRVWKCKPCKRQFSVLTGTIMHATKISVRTWVLVLFEMCASKNGVAAREIERKYGLCPRTAWHMLHRIRQAMDAMGGVFSGDVVADETYIGGEPKNMHADKRPSKVRDYYTHKTPVVSIVDAERGAVRSAVVPLVTGRTLRSLISDTVELPVSTLHTDSSPRYNMVGRLMAGHHAVNHMAGEYVTEKSKGTQMCENFFSQLKRSIDGTHHHVSVEHLDRYLGEFDFRYSTSRTGDFERFETLACQLEGRLTYNRVRA